MAFTSRTALAAVLVVSLVGCGVAQREGEPMMEPEMSREAEMNMMMPAHCSIDRVQRVCPRWDEANNFMMNPITGAKYDLDQQEVPCRSSRNMRDITDPAFQSLGFVKLYPGGHSVCGHGNREFYFMARESSLGRAVPDKVMVAFMSGGWCWNAETCGVMDLQLRTMARDALLNSVAAGSAPSVPEAYSRNDVFASGIFQKEPAAVNNKFGDWALVVIPDCTGDLHMGNRSYTYSPADARKCITAHHRGAANAGMAVDWVIRNWAGAKHVLVLGAGYSEASKASGAHGAAVWAPYIKSKLPNAVVRCVIDSSMAVFGPNLNAALAADPWGTSHAMAPDGSPLLPPAEEWHVSTDEFSTLLEWYAWASPSVAFADISSTDDQVQVADFEVTGGLRSDCCLNGCGCNFGTDFGVSAGAPPFGVVGGGRDWTKSRKVTMLRRIRRMPDNYRSWLHSGERRNWLSSARFTHECAVPSNCEPHSRLVNFLYMFATGTTVFNADGSLQVANLPPTNRTYVNRVFGEVTCSGCLGGILGSESMDAEACTSTLGDAETLFTVAPKYMSDWMALWSLNGWEAPDVAGTGSVYRFGHMYEMREGESMGEVAERFGTTVEELLRLNRNLITHVHNPARVREGDVVCVVPQWHNTIDHMGQKICPSDGQRFGERDALQELSEEAMPGEEMEMQGTAQAPMVMEPAKRL
uniref:LysM domain-containing protein n=1 Tax=Hemiselmis andersenii TaxID=464988 RepID=A0A6U5BHX2_HEMAN|mmetsp:Transcript_39105/g.91354  ORF Transcript_39105/g.91354 Transcript_39105/m.91354 type:complete len:696 (+) Transcript_39105:40-2127(+)